MSSLKRVLLPIRRRAKSSLRRLFSSPTVTSVAEEDSDPYITSAYEQTVGGTRLVRLKHASELTQCDILAKAEYENPGGSVKVLVCVHI